MKATRKMHLSATVSAWGVVLVWATVAVLVHSHVLTPVVIERYALGGQGGFLPVQLLTYSFLTPPTSSPFWSAVVVVFSSAWILGVVSNSAHWMDTWEFVRLYSIGTLGVGLLCWGLAGMDATDPVIYGRWEMVISLMLGTAATRDPKQVGYVWGQTIKEGLSRWEKGAVLWWLGLFFTATYIANPAVSLADSTVRGTVLCLFFLSWLIWPVLAVVPGSTVAMLVAWCLWRSIPVVNSGLWLERMPIAALVETYAPVAVGLAYGFVLRRVHARPRKSK